MQVTALTHRHRCSCLKRPLPVSDTAARGTVRRNSPGYFVSLEHTIRTSRP